MATWSGYHKRRATQSLFPPEHHTVCVCLSPASRSLLCKFHVNDLINDHVTYWVGVTRGRVARDNESILPIFPLCNSRNTVSPRGAGAPSNSPLYLSTPYASSLTPGFGVGVTLKDISYSRTCSCNLLSRWKTTFKQYPSKRRRLLTPHKVIPPTKLFYW